MAAIASPNPSSSHTLLRLSSRRRLDVTSYKHFEPMLTACQDYAALSGFRFRSNSFDCLPRTDSSKASRHDIMARGGVERQEAKRKASREVRDFAVRLKAGDIALLEEVDRAFRIVMVESVRNAMKGMFKALEMFPPYPPPRCVHDEDCSYQDVSAPLPEIAQRLYNDEAWRTTDPDGGPRVEKRAKTSAFLTDFAEACGITLPPVPQTQQGMLKEFSARVQEATERGQLEQSPSVARKAFFEHLGVGPAAERLRCEAKRWWADHWKTVAWTAAGAVLVGGLALLQARGSTRQGELDTERESERAK